MRQAIYFIVAMFLISGCVKGPDFQAPDKNEPLEGQVCITIDSLTKKS